MNKFFEKYWSMGIGLLFVGVLVFALNKKSEATFSNPVMAQTAAAKNANFISVYNQDNVSHGVGSVLIYVIPASATYPGLSVSSTTSANVTRVAGVVYGASIPATSWGILQTYGYNPAVKCAVAVSTGDVIITTTTDEKAGVQAIAITTTTAGAFFAGFGTALETNTSSTTIKAFLRVE